MQTESGTFTQRVRTDGYHWNDTRHPRAGKMVPALREGEDLHIPGPEVSMEAYLQALDEAWRSIPIDTDAYREYRADDIPDLYRKFARLTPTRDAILAFANSYGLIGIGTCIIVDEGENPDGSLWSVDETVEFGHEWAREIGVMKAAVATLDLLDEALGVNVSELSARFSYKGGRWHIRRELVPNHTQRGKADWIDLDLWADTESCFESLGAGDLVVTATEYLRVTVNRQLAGRVEAVLVWDRDRTKTSLVYKPTSLLGAMWLQFSAILTGTSNSRTCIECGNAFEFQRRDRVFCSEACQKRYGRRKARQSEDR